jgi:hypothetical protein
MVIMTNTARYSADTLHANAVIALGRARKKLGYWQLQLERPDKEHRQHWIEHQIGRQRDRIRDLEAALATHDTEGRHDMNAKVPILSDEVLDPSSEHYDEMMVKEVRAHALACDEHAAALAVNIRALHQKITNLRHRHGGRGPAGAVVASALERCAAKYFAGTVLRSLRGSTPRPAQGGFKDQVALWEFTLQAPPAPPTPAPPPPPPMIAA